MPTPYSVLILLLAISEQINSQQPTLSTTSSLSISITSTLPTPVTQLPGQIMGTQKPTLNTTQTGIIGAPDPKLIMLKVGLLFVNGSTSLRARMGFGQSAPAITLALERVKKEHLIDNINITFVWYIDNCVESNAAGFTTRLIEVDKVDAIMGPTCSSSAIISGHLSKYYNVPIFIWGAASASDLSDTSRFPTLSSINTNTNALGLAVHSLLVEYEWKEIGVMYTIDAENGKCDFMQQDLERTLADDSHGITIVYKRVIETTEKSIKAALEALKTRARIILACFDNDLIKRDFLVFANELGMNENDEYVFILPDLRSQGMLRRTQTRNSTYINMWDEAGQLTAGNRSHEALITARHCIVVDVQNQALDVIESFNKKMISLMGGYPFFCNGTCLGTPENETNPSVYSRTLHDLTYMYARALNKTLDSGYSPSDLRNGSLLSYMSRGEFDGMTGHVRINDNGTSEPVFFVTAMNILDVPTVYLTVSVYANIVTVEKQYIDEFTSIWATHRNNRPLYKPECGYTGRDCPANLTLYFVVGGAVIAMLFTAASLGIGYAIREKHRERKRLNMECQIPYKSLRRIPNDMKTVDAMKSVHSVHSSVSGGTRFTMDSHKWETDNHLFFIWNKEIVYAEKFTVRVHPNEEEMAYLRKLRQYDNDNVNKFYGLCMDGPMVYSIWKCCQRGSLKDVIAKESYINDAFVMFALMRDIASGLISLHQSFIGAHGGLTSECCLISDRWQVKIGDHGLGMIRDRQPIRREKLLWVAPELLRNMDQRGTKEGDVYSFAIICSELLNRENVWHGIEKDEEVDAPKALEKKPSRENVWHGIEKDEEVDEVIRRVKKGTDPIYRPEIRAPEDVNPNLLLLIRDCWSENPAQRPNMELVRTLMKQMVKDGNQNLMDYVFGMLELYAGSLEQEVEERTKELVEEKKKSDLLLYRMLPKQVADQLKIGQTVEPESFEMATVFFSDVVSFTTLASRCTPLQVVNLLNQLYTNFDSIIDARDAYKVETIGDGYLVCSGIPRRNGDQHTKEIAEMSFEFMRSLASFRIAHLPNERINLRIGFHTGPVVTGVVGLTMPRYCLFGDTVNTASRMESNGKPGQIHISANANHFLTNIIGGYKTEPRGEIIIKGKGVMETFWLLGHSELEIDTMDRTFVMKIRQASTDTGSTS